MTTIKICGLTRAGDVAEAISTGAQWLGFVHFAKSPRHRDLRQIWGLAEEARRMSVRIRCAVLLVDPDDEMVGQVLARVRPAAIQLHGSETAERVAQVKAMAGKCEVWKALPVSTAEDLAVANTYKAADRFLFDARPPKDADRPGGNGEPFDWTLLKNFRIEQPWFLAGGLTPENVREAIRTSGAKAVDVSTGVESFPGVKDPLKLRRFATAAR